MLCIHLESFYTSLSKTIFYPGWERLNGSGPSSDLTWYDKRKRSYRVTTVLTYTREFPTTMSKSEEILDGRLFASLQTAQSEGSKNQI